MTSVATAATNVSSLAVTKFPCQINPGNVFECRNAPESLTGKVYVRNLRHYLVIMSFVATASQVWGSVGRDAGEGIHGGSWGGEVVREGGIQGRERQLGGGEFGRERGNCEGLERSS